jgi:hypothetical protein
MAYIDPHIIRTLFNELKKSINELYSKNTNLDMVPVLRNTSKVEYFLDGNFEYLWFMEMEENSKLKKLLEEKEDIEYDIRECEIDIAMYTEVMNKLYPRTVGLCGYSCDGQCQQCRSGYDAHDEVFTGGDY